VEKYIITGAMIVTFIAMIVWALTDGRRVRYPKGSRYTFEQLGYKLNVVADPSFGWSQMTLGQAARYSHRSIETLLAVWMDHMKLFPPKKQGWLERLIWPNPVTIDDFRDGLDGICIWLLPHDKYEAEWIGWKAMAKGSNAVLSQLKKPIGGGPPLILVRAPFLDGDDNPDNNPDPMMVIDHIVKTGSPIIHEALHWTRKWDSFHVDPRVWIKGARKWALMSDTVRAVSAERLGIPDQPYPEAATVEAKAYAAYKG